MAVYVVERYLPAMDPQDLASIVERDRRAAIAMAGTGVTIRHLTCIHMPSDELCFSLFDAPSEEALRNAHERAGIGFERIVEAVQVPSPPGSPRGTA